MEYRVLRGTDLEVSAICFGPMRSAAKTPGEDETSKEGMRALEHAIGRGVNFIHSSYEYGTRWALSRVLEGHPKRHDLHHVIKVPAPDWKDDGKFYEARFRQRVEEALRDLHAECIAVVQHLQRGNPHTDEQRIADMPAVHEGLGEVFEKMRDEGKVGHLATFPYTPGFCDAAIASDMFEAVVAYLNPIEMEMTPLFPEMERKGMGCIAIRPLFEGLFADRRIDRRNLPPDDRMRDPRWDAAYDRLRAVKEALGSEVGPSWTTFGVKFALIHPIVASTVVGLNTVAQVDQAVDAANGACPSMDVFEKARQLYERSGPLE